jgi:hypothetical protein
MDPEMDPEMQQLHTRQMTIKGKERKMYEYLLSEVGWDPNYTIDLFKYLRENIIGILHFKRNSLYRTSETKKKHIILDNMMADVLEKMIDDISILRYDKSTGKFNYIDLQNIIQGIAQDDTVRQDPESAEEERVRLDNERRIAAEEERVRLDNERRIAAEEERVRLDNEKKAAEDYLRAHKLNKAKRGELAGDYKGGKRSKNNKKKSKRKHRHNKKSHKKRR